MAMMRLLDDINRQFAAMAKRADIPPGVGFFGV